MRIPSIEFFHIDDLFLDEGNYRFAAAADQTECIAKILGTNPASLHNLMESIALDDLGEPLLAYRPAGAHQATVLDGNRRLAAMKLLHDPSRAPNNATAERARRLAGERNFLFDSIQAQVSDNKAIIAKTVFERHAGAQGIGRIGWNALAAARFRMDNESEDQDWRAMALLVELERSVPRIEAFVDSGKYSHDIFRRIVRRLIANNIIDKGIFHATQQRLSQRPPQGSKEAALEICAEMLDEMAAGNIHLSRQKDSSGYASEANIDALIKARYPDRGAPAGHGSAPPKSEPAASDGVIEPHDTTRPQEGDASTTSSEDPPAPRRVSDALRIAESATIKRLLDEGGHKKLANLYKSLTAIFLGPNPVLMWVGAWSFLESLGARLTTSKNRFDWLIQKTNVYVKTDGVFEDKGTLRTAITRIRDEGNSNKHDGLRYTMDGRQIAIEFQALEGFMIWLLQQQAESSTGEGSGSNSA